MSSISASAIAGSGARNMVCLDVLLPIAPYYGCCCYSLLRCRCYSSSSYYRS